MKENWVYRRGDIYLANLGVPIGSKQGGVRPVVVLQNDVGNFYSPTITVAPLTTKIQKKRSQPTHYFLRKAKGLARSSMVLAEQLDTCDKRNWEAVQVKSNCDMYMICSSHGSHGLRE